ncbi:tetratricopeptide repeat protein [Daejeonella lutea]|uniref:Tetratricopeptide repeat-containing protein n=1 Tax=Daejeonella lutea TaxID=572036 RepID=A0A1T5AGN8_9SPHI|nr:tetratricopeptide repeat protein [Daejeonella lutea]SKB34172.1 Tetratricopeptide repeat-containing protein [Daejeonella lutea]
MKIKSFILAAVLTASSVLVYAQKGEVANAKKNYDSYVQLKDANSMPLALPSLKTAKTAVDKAVANEKTAADPAAWTYKALIYGELALMDSVPATSKPLIAESQTAYKKAVELDKDGANKANLDHVNGAIFSQYELNQGVKAYQTNNFADAYTAFTNALTYRPGDTTITYYAGLSAINSKNYDAGIKNYEALVKTNFSANNQIYLDLSRLYSMKGDTAKAITIAGEGATKFKDPALATQEIELSLMSGKQKEVITKIAEQAKRDPKNKLYPYYLGIAYSTVGDPVKAEESYLQAIAIDPTFADASINIGGVMLNKGIALYNEANKLPPSQQKEYDAAMKKASVEFEKAFPYLQKATELDPKSRIALENLKTYYLVKKDNAKVEELTKKIEAL